MKSISLTDKYLPQFSKIKVGAYCRVSTTITTQQNSFEAQKTYFQQLFKNSATEELVDIYADYGLSGTKSETAKHRDYWECTDRFDFDEPCKNPIIYDDALNAAWQRLCVKLKRHADDIITPCLVQLSMLEENMNSGEISELEKQEKELLQRRYVICQLCAENCITHEKLFESEKEIDSQLAEIDAKIEKLSNDIDDTAEQLELLYKLITTTSAERLVDLILEKIVIDNGTAVFELKGGLKLKEVL